MDLPGSTERDWVGLKEWEEAKAYKLSAVTTYQSHAYTSISQKLARRGYVRSLREMTSELDLMKLIEGFLFSDQDT